MYNINEFFALLNEYAPLSYSKELIEKGDYDNSGILIKTHPTVNKVLFSLDLSLATVKRAKALGVDTVVTHHPAIYNPIKTLDIETGENASVLLAIKNNLNVISMHLNLDVAENGIDQCLAQGLGAGKSKILQPLSPNVGYGREFCFNKKTLGEFVKEIKNTFGTNRLTVYGNKNFQFNKVASFCGAGATEALNAVNSGVTNADVIVTSDAKHNVIVELVEKGKAIVLLTHYSAENYGFKKYYQKINSKIGEKICSFYFEDKRFI